MQHAQRAAANDEANPLAFVLSDATLDRYGDIIEPAGWRLTQFRKNPIALFGHNSASPIGVWKNVRVENDQLRGELGLAAKGTSPLIDTLHALIEQKVLRAVSVGFKPIETEPLDPAEPWNGTRYKKQELVECSLVSVPANPNALSIARSFGLSAREQELIFAKPAPEVPETRKPAKPEPLPQGTTRMMMKTLAQRIEESQANLNQFRDALSAAVNDAGDDPDEGQSALVDELSQKIEDTQRSLDSLNRAERAMALTTRQVVQVHQPTEIIPPEKPKILRAKKVEPRDYVYRALVVRLRSHVNHISIEDALKQSYPGDDATMMVLKAASAPAMTSVVGWAAELVNTVIGDFIESLQPFSVYPELSQLGARFSFDRNGIIKLPARLATPNVAGDFVAEGAPIPVKQMALTSVSLTPKKMAVISAFTRELAMHSTPSIESVLREAMAEDTAIVLDTRLLDTNAATTARPAGLLNGVTPIAATAAGTGAMVTDLKNLVNAITAQNGGRRLVFLMNPAQALAMSLAVTTTGDVVDYRAKLGIPVITSTAIAAGTVILVDAADFASATGDTPEFDISDTATLHMEDTTPLAIGTAGAPATVAAPTRSLFQTASLAIRMLLDVTWAMRRPGMVQAIVGVNW